MSDRWTKQGHGAKRPANLRGQRRICFDTAMQENHTASHGPGLGWQWKAIIPIIGVLLLGLLQGMTRKDLCRLITEAGRVALGRQ